MRALIPSEAIGRGFESLRARHSPLVTSASALRASRLGPARLEPKPRLDEELQRSLSACLRLFVVRASVTDILVTAFRRETEVGAKLGHFWDSAGTVDSCPNQIRVMATVTPTVDSEFSRLCHHVTCV